jgi:hypothetical protein
VYGDTEIVEALSVVGVRMGGDGHSDSDYSIDDFRLQPGVLDIRVRQRGGSAARAEIDLPSSGRLQPWLYVTPIDLADWVGQFLIWLDEEVFTSGLINGRERRLQGGESYVLVEAYGWRVDDPSRHQQMTDSSTASRIYGWEL